MKARFFHHRSPFVPGGPAWVYNGTALDFIETINRAKAMVPFTLRHNFPAAITTCILIEDGVEKSRGFAICSPKDQFSRKIGRAIALGRAKKGLTSGE